MGHRGVARVSAKDREHFRRIAEVDDVEGIFAARAVAGDPLDWAFLDHWTSAWGNADRLAPYRERYGR